MIYDVAALPEQVMYRTMKEMYNELGTSAPEDMIFMHYPGVGSRGTVLWKDRGRLVAVTIKLVSDEWKEQYEKEVHRGEMFSLSASRRFAKAPHLLNSIRYHFGNASCWNVTMEKELRNSFPKFGKINAPSRL